MVDLTPPSSSANTPKREMDVDERRYSSGSDGPGGGPGSDTELDEAEPIETGQATPPLVEGDTAPSAGTGTGAAASDPQAKSKKSRRAKDSLYESDIVQRWDREIGDIFVHPAASSQPSSQPSSQSQSQAQTETETQAPSPAQGQ